MKIRVKFCSGDSSLHRVEVPNTCTVEELATQLRNTIPGLKNAISLPLSLNKKDVLDASPNATLSGVGVCSGDTVWIMSERASQTTQAQVTPSETSAAQTVVEPSAPAAEPMAEDLDHAHATGGDIDDGEEMDATDEDIEFGGAAEGPSIPDFLQRVLSTSLEGSTPPSPHNLLQLAVHAVMLESGFTSQSSAGSEYCIPKDCRSLQYSWRGLPQDHHAAIRFIPMGTFLILHIAVEGKSTTRVASINLNTTQHVVSPSTSPMTTPATTTNTNTSSSSGASSSTPLSSTTGLISRNGNSHVPAALLQYQNVPALWVQMKDAVVLPLLAALHHVAGKQPPLGLLTLPMEIKLDVLRRLQAKALAAVAASCSELRHLSSTDQLWRPLFLKDFPTSSTSDVQEAERRGWKWAYCRHHQLRSAHQRRRFNVRQPYPLTFPVGGPRLFTPPFPLGVIGGDYDRLPMQGFPATGGGIMGGAFGGGHGLNPTGGPRFPGQRGRDNLLNAFRQY